MKKFLKKRSSSKNLNSPTQEFYEQNISILPSPVPSPAPAAPNAEDQILPQINALALENQKLKSALQSLSQENIRLQDRLGAREAEQNEIKRLAQSITEENDRLRKEIFFEKKQVEETCKIYETNTQRQILEMQNLHIDSERLRNELRNSILQNDELRIHSEILAQKKTENEKIDEYRSSFETCRSMLADLKGKYEEELQLLRNALRGESEEKRTLALRLSKAQAETDVLTQKQRLSWENANVLEQENLQLCQALAAKDERASKMQTILDELLAITKELAKTRKRDANFNEVFRTNLTKLEEKCRKLKDDNERLRKFKNEAVSKLVEAKNLLSDETETDEK